MHAPVQAATCLPRFTPQGLANTLNAFAKFSFDPGARFWQRVGLLLFTENDNERTKATLSLTLFEVRRCARLARVRSSVQPHRPTTNPSKHPDLTYRWPPCCGRWRCWTPRTPPPWPPT